FFFSSRRRHTRCYRDWSSDVCSSDLRPQQAQARSAAAALTAAGAQARQADLAARAAATDQRNAVRQARLTLDAARFDRENAVRRSEERRGGKEGRSARWSAQEKRQCD